VAVALGTPAYAAGTLGLAFQALTAAGIPAVGLYQDYRARQTEAAKIEELKQLREEMRQLRQRLPAPIADDALP